MGEGIVIDQRHAERMKYALERIVEGLHDYAERPPEETMSAREVLWVAERALDPDEWERVRID